MFEHLINGRLEDGTGERIDIMNPAVRVYSRPKHPYTEALLSAVPQLDPETKMERIILPGEVANPANSPSGCYFHPRCNYAKNICKTDAPKWEEAAPGHFVVCHFSKKLTLKGVD